MARVRSKQLSEAAIQRSIVTAYRAAGVFVVKLLLLGFTGMPDLITFLKGGRILLVEVKKPGGKLSARQKYVFKILERLGHKVHVVFSKEEAQEVLKCQMKKALYQ